MNENRYKARVFAAVALALTISVFLASPTHAQSAEDLAQCASIERDRQRLACYDALVPVSTANSAQSSAPSANPAPEVAGAATVSVSDSSSSSNRDERRRRQRDRDAVEVVIVDVYVNFTGRAAFTTKDGDVYVQTSTESVRHGEPPFPATLEPGTFGSFFLSPNDENARIRVSLRD